jgi:hypothetical protein
VPVDPGNRALGRACFALGVAARALDDAAAELERSPELQLLWDLPDLDELRAGIREARITRRQVDRKR